MESIREIYKIGHGPSSSHTMGPAKAAKRFLESVPDAATYRIFLYGSLAATGKGHLTDVAILEVFNGKSIEIVWKPETFLPKHPNALKFEAFGGEQQLIKAWTVYSVGGGAIIDDFSELETRNVYTLSKLDDILNYCNENGKQLWEFVEDHEGPGIWDYLAEVWKVMDDAISRGLKKEGTLPGSLMLPRKSSSFNLKAQNFSGPFKKRSKLFAYALAVSEENASGGLVVTAPTCGACGVLTAVLKLMSDGRHRISFDEVVETMYKTGKNLSNDYKETSKAGLALFTAMPKC